ncbi:MAG: hypothetical protein MJZ68_09125 [archaeon]|nr:hypothetical protein [archaeon]
MKSSLLYGALTVLVAVIAVFAVFAAIGSDSNDGHDKEPEKEPEVDLRAHVATCDELYSALEKGSDVVLESDMVFTEKHISLSRNWDLYVPEGTVSTLDLNGHSITCVSTWGIKVFGDLTIKGGGDVINRYTVNSVVAGAAKTSDAVLRIYGGSYNNLGDSETILARDGSSVEIYGGTFTSKVPSVTYSNGCVLNIEDKSTSKITVYGGRFLGYDPATGDGATGRSTFVAEGYVSEMISEKVFEVKKVSV